MRVPLRVHSHIGFIHSQNCNLIALALSFTGFLCLLIGTELFFMLLIH